jgi:O-methyltransferase
MSIHSIAHSAARTMFRLANRVLNPAGILLSKPGVIHGSPAFSGATTWSRRLLAIEEALDMVEGVEGAIVESGVHWGYGILAMLHATRKNPRHIYGFDSFEGHSAPTAADRSGGRFIVLGNSFATTQDDVWRTLELGMGRPASELKEHVTLIKGWMQETVPVFARSGPRLALVHVDPDFYEPVKASVDHLWPLLAPGGMMIVGRLDNPELGGKARAIAEFREGASDCQLVERDLMDTDGVVARCSFLIKTKDRLAA